MTRMRYLSFGDPAGIEVMLKFHLELPLSVF